MKTKRRAKQIHAIDLFCGVGGLSYGLTQAGINVVAGVDIDSNCEFAFEENIQAPFFERDIRKVTGDELIKLYPKSGIRLLAGCAPCQPFSRHMRGADTSEDEKWTLLDEFSRLVREVKPELVTMENVVGLSSTVVFKSFVAELEALGYFVDWRSCHGVRFGLAQNRRRLVLVASNIAPIKVPKDQLLRSQSKTVRDVIGKLPPVASGQCHPRDRLHRARSLTDLNLRRIRSSKPGGTWRDWPESLRSACHRKATGASFQSVYARMEWDAPAPTITTQAHNFGTGRFGHPDQDRALTLREAAMLQGFPRRYRFVGPKDDVHFSVLGRLIGNAVPPPLALAIGHHFTGHISDI